MSLIKRKPRLQPTDEVETETEQLADITELCSNLRKIMQDLQTGMQTHEIQDWKVEALAYIERIKELDKSLRGTVGE